MYNGALLKNLVLSAGVALAGKALNTWPEEAQGAAACSSTYCPLPVNMCQYTPAQAVLNLESMIDFYRSNKSPKIKKLDKSNAKVDQAQVRSLQEALVFHGYLDQVRNGELDAETLDAISVYRRVNALPSSGRIDSYLVSHLAISSGRRVKLLEEVLDKVRFMSAENSIHVNIPEFKLRFYSDGMLKAELDVIVGSRKEDGKWHTNVQRGSLEKVEVNPWWNVPRGDMTDEVRKDLERYPLLRSTMVQLVSGSWVPVKGGVHGARFRQKPGNGNSLGRLAYVFNSRYGEFLHGTPNKRLFRNNVRAYSHGCIRLEDEFYLFNALKDAGLADADLDGLLNAREGSTYKTGYVVLSEPVDVHVAYLRAWVEEGSYGLRMVMPPDVYDYGDSRFR